MRNGAALGYLLSAALYLMAWMNPYFGTGQKLIQWVAFEKLCLAEFLSCHATTLLAAVAMTTQMEANDPTLPRIFWGLMGRYGVLGAGAHLFHRDHGVPLQDAGVVDDVSVNHSHY